MGTIGLGQKILLGKKKTFWVKKLVGQKNNLGKKKFGLKIIFGSKNYLGQKNFESKNILGQKNFG